jgi:FtsH-binding integral membrane protein
MFSKTWLYKFILSIIGIAAVVLGVLLYLTPAAIFPDPSWGFQVMRSMELGGGFNMITTPDPTNLAKNTSWFLTWWSPGQYLVPYFFKVIFAVNTGQAAAITTTVCQIIGLAGFYAFFKKAGFGPLISALSLGLIVCQQAFFNPYIFYNGGEVLLFAFLGWFLYGCIALDKPGIKLALFVLFTGWIGFICKSSFIWMYAAGLLLYLDTPITRANYT